MNYRILYTLIFFVLPYTSVIAQQTEKKAINEVLSNWHLAAAEASFDTYFGMMTNDAVFIGTDATENWKNEDFKAFAKPYFDKGKAWCFVAIERNIYLDDTSKIAWFDELLNTQMKICRGSGILKKINGEWKIAHYVLSITIPNDNVEKVVKEKSIFDDKLINQLENND